VFKDGGSGNLLPNAINDSYTTDFDVPLSGNVLDTKVGTALLKPSPTAMVIATRPQSLSPSIRLEVN
jgi:hypothetical protein